MDLVLFINSFLYTYTQIKKKKINWEKHIVQYLYLISKCKNQVI